MHHPLRMILETAGGSIALQQHEPELSRHRAAELIVQCGQLVAPADELRAQA
ncbi:MAG TPA: hypothetical protein VFI54_02115 [Solirubrobacteraceae bacterium]|nr:hypothetical protein [Solirubrobacteraceae bacterium]